jgi:hypothetical protein
MISQPRPYEIGAGVPNAPSAPRNELEARNLSTPAAIALWLFCGPLNLAMLAGVATLLGGLLLVGAVLGADMSSPSAALKSWGEAVVVFVKEFGPDGSNGLGFSGASILVLGIHLVVFWCAIPFAFRWVKRGECHAFAVLAKCLGVGALAYAVSGVLGGVVFSLGLQITNGESISHLLIVLLMLICSASVMVPGLIYAAILIRIFGVRQKQPRPPRFRWAVRAWRALNAYNGL